MNLMLGTDIGSYRVLSKIGEGGMGSVYVAQHQLLGRKAAIKVLLKELSTDPSIVQRFINEARATSQIVHPGVVRIYDFGQLPDGSTYMLMELLQGETLRERVKRRGKVPLDQALALVRQIAEALGAAHQHRVVHRDLKPENIFIVADTTVPLGVQAKILDFGIAKLLDPSVGAPQTRAGSIIGTPQYMSPEQCRAAPNIDHRADLYACGGIFFFLLCARPPFTAANVGELLAAHINTPPTAPSSLVAGIPPWVDAVVLRLLAKKPEERFQSTAELLAALDAGMAVPASAHPAASDEATVIGTHAAAQLALLKPPPAVLTPPPARGHATPTPPPLVTPTPSGRTPSGLTPSKPPLLTPPPPSLTPPQPPLVTPTPPPLVTPPGGTTAPTPPTPAPLGDTPDARDGSATLARTAMEIPSLIPQPHRSGVSTPVLLGGAFVLTIVVGLGGFYLLARHRAPPPEEAPRPTTVTFTLDSDPAGAEVYSDGVQVCVTPCRLERPPRPGQVTWTVAKEGYDEQPLTLATDRDGQGRVTLRPQKNP
jgi:serine/threonine protein kinase